MEKKEQRNHFLVIDKAGGPEKLRLDEGPIAETPVGHALIRVLVAGIAFTDLAVMNGTYFRKFPFPLIPGYDFVGVVEKLNEEKKEHPTQVKVGDRVAVMCSHRAFQKYVNWPIEDLVVVPPELDPAVSVAMILNYTTAYQLLHRAGKIQAGQSILVHSGAGGTGSSVLDLLGSMDTGAIFTTCSGAKRDVVLRICPKATVIDYKKDKFEDVVKAAGGVDIALDAVGGSNFKRSYSAVKRGGTLVAYGFTGGNVLSGFGSLGLAKLTCWDGKHADFFGIVLLKEKNPAFFREDLARLFQMLKEGRVHPLIHSKVRFEDAGKALVQVAKMEHAGKSVLIVDDDLIAQAQARGELANYG